MVKVCDETWHFESSISNVETAEGGRTEQVSLDCSCEEGALLLSVSRTGDNIVSEASWDTLQVGDHEHAKFGNRALKLNHARNPNTRVSIEIHQINLISTRPITAGEALSFNYNTTEWKMADPFIIGLQDKR
jgi:hypothetical protein